MLMVNIADAKAKLSEYVEVAASGERVLICNRNKPVAELRAVDQAPAVPRDLSPMFPGHTFLTDAFFEPMSEADLHEWYGGPAWPARVAETPATYGKSAKKKTRRT
jgi:antitoxin (DNA-binding transcriptional repressor) of toxin-antitoxin stability system